MEKEYKTEELTAVWEALLKAFSEKQAGCTAQDIASATGLSEEVARACLEYLRQTGKVERAGELYVPEAKAVEAKGDVGMTARRYRTRSPEAMPGREMRFAAQKAGSKSLPTKEVLAYLRRRPFPYPSTAEIAVALGLHVDDVLEALEMLEDHGKVKRRKHKGHDIWRVTEI